MTKFQTDTVAADRRRLTIYLPEELHAAICAHADSAGQKLSTFISRELAHLVEAKPLVEAGELAVRQHRFPKRGAR